MNQGMFERDEGDNDGTVGDSDDLMMMVMMG